MEHAGGRTSLKQLVLPVATVCILFVSQFFSVLTLHAQSEVPTPEHQVFLPYVHPGDIDSNLGNVLPPDETFDNSQSEDDVTDGEFSASAVVTTAGSGPSKEEIDEFARRTGEFPDSDYPYYTRPNGCGPPEGVSAQFIPDGWWFVDFRDACNNHDLCGSTLGNSKQTCDTNFRNDMIAAVEAGLQPKTKDVPILLCPLFIPCKVVVEPFSGTYKPTAQDVAVYYASGMIPQLGPTMADLPTFVSPPGLIVPKSTPGIAMVDLHTLLNGRRIAEFYYQMVDSLGQSSYDLRQSQAAKYKELVDSYIRFYDGGEIAAELSGSVSPPTKPNANLGDMITNGDFSIVRTGDSTTLGNGIDEQTDWTFDFSPHIRYISAVYKAELELNLKPFRFC